MNGPMTKRAKGHEARPPAEMLVEMIRGYQLSQLIYVAAKLGIAELLEDGPKNSDELGRAVGANPRNLSRVLRALAAHDIFEETADGRYALNPLADPLGKGIPWARFGFTMVQRGSGPFCERRSWIHRFRHATTKHPALRLGTHATTGRVSPD